jgi:predicted HAD superfamily Cof-like phosphohydrolase
VSAPEDERIDPHGECAAEIHRLSAENQRLKDRDRLRDQLHYQLRQPTFFDDVGRFHRKFDLPVAGLATCVPMTKENEAYRIRFLQEELDEFKDACAAGDLPEMVDALVDLAWVAMGTAHYLGAPFNEAWAEVVRANLEKIRVANDPNKPYRAPGAVVKPQGWAPPRIGEVIDEHNVRVFKGEGSQHV